MRKFHSVLCSPHAKEVFAIGSAENLKLYQFEAGHQGDSRGTAQSISMVSSVSDVQQMKCLAWSPQPDQPWTLATGTAAGKIILHVCSPAHAQHHGDEQSTTALREFVPRFQRVCFSVAWNEIHTQHLAAGLDKVRR